MATIADNLQAVKARIARAAERAGRDPGGVTLLAVSKTHPAARIAEAQAAGQRAFGENYVQEALAKMEALPALEWHLIGPLQSNKTRIAAEHFLWVHTVASEKIARRLSEQRPQHLPPLNVLLQLNVSAEPSKSGVAVSEAPSLARAVAALPRLKLRGVMAIPEAGADRIRYRQVREAFEGLKGQFDLDTISMGMSDDMELAVAEGATLVRIGTAIFGARAMSQGHAA
jgi:hypothetical protein